VFCLFGLLFFIFEKLSFSGFIPDFHKICKTLPFAHLGKVRNLTMYDPPKRPGCVLTSREFLAILTSIRRPESEFLQMRALRLQTGADHWPGKGVRTTVTNKQPREGELAANSLPFVES